MTKGDSGHGPCRALSGCCKSHKFPLFSLFSRTAFKALFLNIGLPLKLCSQYTSSSHSHWEVSTCSYLTGSFHNTVLKTVAQTWRCHFIGSLITEAKCSWYYLVWASTLWLLLPRIGRALSTGLILSPWEVSAASTSILMWAQAMEVGIANTKVYSVIY